MRLRRFEALLFALAWLSYAWFHEGGGWNQNGRFAQTRALVESRRPWIDDDLVYVPAAPGTTALRRLPVRDGVFTFDGTSYALSWYAGDGPLVPLSSSVPAATERVTVDALAVTGDLAFARGHAVPNKAPGVSLAAIPGYALVRGVEGALGRNADDAWTMTLNAWLAGVFSVGLAAALAIVAFHRLGMRLFPGKERGVLVATLALAFGSLWFPYATMLYEHDLAAAALVGAFLFTLPRDGESDTRPGRLAAAGALAGASIVASYLSVLGAAILLAYVVHRARGRGASAFVAGTVLPLALLGAYNVACFGRLVTTSYAWQNPLFLDAGRGAVGIFAWPDPRVLALLLVSPLRGLFTITPIFAAGVAGLVVMLRSRSLRAEALVCLAMVVSVLAFNVSFRTWHGGWACGPRYLIPALPFLALPIALVADRARTLVLALLAVSVATMVVATAVDPQTPWIPAGDMPSMQEALTSPVWSVDAPRLLGRGPGDAVSTNEGGIYEALSGRFTRLGAAQARRNAFNAGEAIAPGRAASLLPWLAIVAGLGWMMRRAGQGAV